MFEKLLAEGGLSLDRLKTLLEVAVGGSIVKAADGDPVRQSQYSRQIKELEEFFRVQLVERQGRGTRLTPNGRELARISRFFMMGLANFQRGCLAADQAFRIGASATVARQFLLPVLAGVSHGAAEYATETLSDAEIEPRLQDLTLDFGIVMLAVVGRPLQARLLGKWRLQLWVPRAAGLTEAAARRAFRAQQLPLVKAGAELDALAMPSVGKYSARLVCANFLEARAALEGGKLAALLPDFMAPTKAAGTFCRVRVPEIDARHFAFFLAWNPRLLRLNPHAARWRDWLAGLLSQRMAG
jgi:DNA-binding transcriptional LysR family regulator